MENLIYRSNIYYFNRRVPANLYEYERRRLIRFSLKTDSLAQASKLAALENIKLENYWKGLIETGKKVADDDYRQAINCASLHGFSYIPLQTLANGPLEEIVKRVLYLEKQLGEKQTEALLGAVKPPEITLRGALAKFWDLSKDITLSKSPRQIRAWKNPRRLAMHNFINCVGNKLVREICRDDLLKFKAWWIAKILKEERTTATANKNFIQVKTIIKTVCKNFKIKLDIDEIFSELRLDYDYEPREPFTSEYITNRLLSPNNLYSMRESYQGVLQVFAETGIGVDEQAGILPEDIFLDDPVPHVVIKPRAKDKLKTKYRRRIIPLTGYALLAFKKFPNGFAEHIKNPDSVSSALNKYLRENKLMPSDKHSVYSLRHSFQDRLTSANCPDRIQVDLMGHKFQRPLYGKGASIEEKHEWMKRICLLRGSD